MSNAVETLPRPVQHAPAEAPVVQRRAPEEVLKKAEEAPKKTEEVLKKADAPAAPKKKEIDQNAFDPEFHPAGSYTNFLIYLILIAIGIVVSFYFLRTIP